MADGELKRERPQIRPVPNHGLRRFFEVLVWRAFRELWVWDRQLAEHVVDVLVRFARTDALYRMGEIERRPIRTVTEQLIEVSALGKEDSPRVDLERTRNLQQHIGDYTLFMSGMFRPFLQRHRILDLYLEQGSKAYLETAALDRKLYRPGAHCFEALGSEFERLSGAIDYMRNVYLAPAAEDSPYRELLDRFDRYS